MVLVRASAENINIYRSRELLFLSAEKYLSEIQRLIDDAVLQLLPGEKSYPECIHEAMHYSLLAGGKRLRPGLVIAAAEAVGGDRQAVLPFAVATELIHTYTLVHDDLPALDNDDYRRGTLSSHKKFGEDIAILAGDALLTMAFELLSRAIEGLKNHLTSQDAAQIIGQTALAAGREGMVGGQVADIRFSSKNINNVTIDEMKNKKSAFFRDCRKALDYIHLNKTARLIELSCLLGGLLVGANKKKKKALSDYGRKIGLAFQITDDLLDDTPDSSDARNFRLTYPAIYGKDKALQQAQILGHQASESLSVFEKNSPAKKFLQMLSYFISIRKK